MYVNVVGPNPTRVWVRMTSKLGEKRAEYGITQADAAKIAGVERSTVFRWIENHTVATTGDRLIRVIPVNGDQNGDWWIIRLSG